MAWAAPRFPEAGRFFQGPREEEKREEGGGRKEVKQSKATKHEERDTHTETNTLQLPREGANPSSTTDESRVG